MSFIELRQLDSVNVDVCVVGSGPVGACIAVELVERGLSVLVLESGLETTNAQCQARSDAIIEDPRFHEPMALATRRGLGGTSWLWGGRCTELEQIDFSARDYMPDSGWPLPHDALSRFYPRAAELLGIGNGVFRTEATLGKTPSGDLEFDHVEIWANETRINQRLEVFDAYRRVKMALNATVVDIEIDPHRSSVAGLVVARQGQRVVFRGAKHYVLAMGGVETARFLLNVQASHPRLFGGTEGALGRFYMGHLSGNLANICFSSPRSARHFAFRDQHDSASRTRITFSHAAQQRLRIPNIAFWPNNPPLADAAHKSGFLSASYLLLNIPGLLPSALIADVLRRTELRDPSPISEHLRNCIIDFPGVVTGGASFLFQRILRNRRIPRWFDVNDSGIYRLHYHAEQRPSATNRISLVDERDESGLRRAAIKFSFSSEDVDSVYAAHKALDESLRGAGLGSLDFPIPRDQFFSSQLACSADGLHQIGTTRIADHPTRGVVDADCRAFEFDNLFIAGSSVFPTSGQANPTFPAISLGIRLAAHLERSIKHQQAPAVLTSKTARLKILHVISSIDAASGGPSRAVFDLALAAHVRGHEVTICATNYGGKSIEYADYVRAGIQVKIFPISGPAILQYSPALERFVRENIRSFDIVHLHSLYLYHDWIVYRCASRHSVPYILRPHGTFDPVIRNRKRLRKWVMNELFQERVTMASAGIHYTSADELRLSNCSKRTAWIVPLPIRPEEFDNQKWDADFMSRYGVRPHFALFLGRLAWKKGADILLEAFARFAKRFPDTDLVVAGPDDGEERKLRELTRKLGLAQRIHFTGLLDGPSRVAAYRMAKAFVLPSRGENFGRAVVEAMLVGIPVLMTDRVGIWEQVAAADAAYIARPDVESVLQGLFEIWESYPRARDRAVRARKLVEAQFGIAAVGEQLERMYQEALAA